MRLILKYLLYNLRLKKFRTALIIIFLILCNTLIISNMAINDYYEKAYKQNITYQKGNVDLFITPKDSSELFKEGGTVLDQSYVNNWFEVFGGIGKTQRDEDDIKITFVGCDIKSAISTGMIHGIDVPKGTKDSVVISEDTSRLIGKSEGDTLTVSVLGSKDDLIITDIAEASGAFSNDGKNAITIAMNLNKVQDYFHSKEKVSAVYVCLYEGVDVDEAVDGIQADNDNISIEESYDMESFNQQKSATSLALMVAMLIMLFVSIYLISFISKIIFIERMQVMGTFQSVGAVPYQTAVIFLGENLCYGLFGWIGGSGLAFFVCPYVFEMLNTFQTSEKIDSVISPFYYFSALICSAVLMVFCSMASIIRMNQMSVKELLFADGNQGNGITFKSIGMGIACWLAVGCLYIYNTSYHLVLGILLFILTVAGSIILCKIIISIFIQAYHATIERLAGGSFSFGVNNVKRDKLLSSNVALITIIVSMMLCIIMVILSVKSSMTIMLGNNDFDISCTSLSADLSDYDSLKSIEGVKDTYFDYLTSTIAYVNENNSVSVSVIGVQNEEIFYKFRSGSIAYKRKQAEKLSDGKYVLVDSFWADKNGMEVGNNIKLCDPDTGKIIEDSYEILDFIDSSGFVTSRNAIMISQKNFDKDMNIMPYQCLIKIEDGSKVDRVAKAVSNELIETTTVIRTLNEVVEGSMAGVDALIMILYIIIGVSALLILFGVINNITVSFLSRKREIAVLYSTSMSRRQLVFMFYGEILTIYTIVVIYAGTLSYLYQFIMPKILWSAGLAFHIEYPIEALIVTAAVLFVVLNFLVMIPVVNLYHMKTVEVLKYE